MLKKTLSKITAFLLSLFISATPVMADLTLSISENGSGSSNETAVVEESTVNVTQTNEADITNDIGIDANTGDNTTSDNTGGDTAIDTGDISTDTSIANTQINTSIVEIKDEPSQVDVQISGNGADSINTASLTTSFTANATITQGANISNNITGTANTGNNDASDNTGSAVSINTGDIWVLDQITNNAINNAYIDPPLSYNFSGSINGNGYNSVNQIIFDSLFLFNALVENIAQITNSSTWHANTGGNTANGNVADSVDINTGDINININIVNDNINSSDVQIGGDSQSDPGSDPLPGGGQVAAASASSDDSNDNDDDGDSTGGGDVLGDILPATGSDFLLWATLANMLMLFMGVYLKTPANKSLRLVVSFS